MLRFKIQPQLDAYNVLYLVMLQSVSVRGCLGDSDTNLGSPSA